MASDTAPRLPKPSPDQRKLFERLVRERGVVGQFVLPETRAEATQLNTYLISLPLADTSEGQVLRYAELVSDLATIIENFEPPELPNTYRESSRVIAALIRLLEQRTVLANFSPDKFRTGAAA